MWREELDPRIIAAEEPMLQIVFKIGLLGCVFSFIMSIVSNSIDFWWHSILFSESDFDFIQLIQLIGIISYITYPLSFIASALTAIGFFALFRRNGSKFALPYVFLSLFTYGIPSYYLLSLFGLDVYIALTNLVSITLTIIVTWILWTIRDTVSDRRLLKSIVLVRLIPLLFGYPFSYLLLALFPTVDILTYFLLNSPFILLGLTRILLTGRLFMKEAQVLVIDDESSPVASSEWL